SCCTAMPEAKRGAIMQPYTTASGRPAFTPRVRPREEPRRQHRPPGREATPRTRRVARRHEVRHGHLAATSSSPDLRSALLELLYRYAHGHFAPNVRQRLAALFQTSPPDAVERFERAARPLLNETDYASSSPAD